KGSVFPQKKQPDTAFYYRGKRGFFQYIPVKLVDTGDAARVGFRNVRKNPFFDSAEQMQTKTERCVLFRTRKE
ncbi:MAG: hypothetical protein ACI4LH_09680, partial [Candidatus Heritagella sp.]